MMSKRLLRLTLNKSFPTIFSNRDASHQIRLISLSFPYCKFISNTGRSCHSSMDAISSKELSLIHDCLVGSSDSSQQEAEQCKFSADALLISSAINESNNVLDMKVQNFLRKFRDKLSESLIIDVFKLVKNPHLSVQFFLWAGQQVGYNHTTRVFYALLDVIGFDENDRIPKHFLEEIQDDDREVLGKLLNFLVKKCCHNGRWNVALEELGRLKDFGYKPSKSTYNALVQVFLEAGRLDTACLLHVQMYNAGFKMDISTLSCLVYALCKAGNSREALNLVEKEDFVPDTKLYTTMVSGLCEASLFDEAMDFLNRMKSSSSLPNVLTYRVLLCGCLRKQHDLFPLCFGRLQITKISNSKIMN